MVIRNFDYLKAQLAELDRELKFKNCKAEGGAEYWAKASAAAELAQMLEDGLMAVTGYKRLLLAHIGLKRDALVNEGLEHVKTGFALLNQRSGCKC